MRYTLISSNRTIEYDNLLDLLNENMEDKELVDWINGIYNSQSPLPSFLRKKTSIGELAKIFLTEEEWNELFNEMIDVELEAIEEELSWQEEENGTKALPWKDMQIVQLKEGKE